MGWGATEGKSRSFDSAEVRFAQDDRLIGGRGIPPKPQRQGRGEDGAPGLFIARGLIEVRGLPGLKIDTWGTHLFMAHWAASTGGAMPISLRAPWQRVQTFCQMP
jgi:hypothetical protein